MTNEGILLPIQFSLEEARQALAQLEGQARSAGVKIGDGVGGGAAKGLGALKSQMSQGREAAMFFTASLGEFGPQGRTAQLALAGVGGAIMGGGGLLMALSLAQAGVRVLVDAWEAESKAAAEAAEAAKKVAEERSKARWELNSFAREHLGTLKGMRDELLATEKLTAAQRAHNEVKAINAALVLAQAQGGSTRQLETRLAEAKALEKEIDLLERAVKARVELAAFEERGLAIQSGALKAMDDAQKQSAAGVSEALQEKARVHKAYVDDLFDQLQRKWDRGVPVVKPDGGGTRDPAAEAREAARKLEEQSIQDLKDMSVGAYQSMARAAVSAFGPMLSGSRAHTAALRAQGIAVRDTADLSAAAFAAILQEMLGSFAQQAAVRSLFEIGEGFAAIAVGDPRAPVHFKSAAIFAGVAALAGAGAVGIGNSRGMTAAERADVASQSAYQGGSSSVTSGGPREFGGGAPSSAGTVHTREIIVIADALDTPAETARRAVRRLELARELNMMPARSAL